MCLPFETWHTLSCQGRPVNSSSRGRTGLLGFEGWGSSLLCDEKGLMAKWSVKTIGSTEYSCLTNNILPDLKLLGNRAWACLTVGRKDDAQYERERVPTCLQTRPRPQGWSLLAWGCPPPSRASLRLSTTSSWPPSTGRPRQPNRATRKFHLEKIAQDEGLFEGLTHNASNKFNT